MTIAVTSGIGYDRQKSCQVLYEENPMVSRPGLPGITVGSTAAATVAANGDLSTWGFNFGSL